MRHLSTPRSLPPVLLTLALVASVLFVSGTAGADTRSDRAEVRRKRAALAAEIDTLKATDAQVESALRTLNANVASQTAALRDAQREAADAQAALQRATEKVQAKEAEIAALDKAVKDLAVEAYIRPQASNGIVDSLESENIGEAELKQALLEARSASQIDALDLLERARQDLELARSQAAEAATVAEQKRAAVDGRLQEVTVARDQQAKVASEVQSRLDHRLGEAANLAALDKQLSDELNAQQARLAAQLAAERRSGGGGPISITGSGEIVSVRGIRVHRSIASKLAAMLQAAENDGISLSGGGYRDPSRQVALRRQNCGTSNYAVYYMSPSACHPPTARPGTSMHERGLAIDFTYGGRAIRSHSSPAYQWLRAHASSYGFYNLPSEAWHWSVNGR